MFFRRYTQLGYFGTKYKDVLLGNRSIISTVHQCRDVLYIKNHMEVSVVFPGTLSLHYSYTATMELKQYFFITAKDNDVLKACFIMFGTDKGLQLLTQVIESNKLIFGGVILPTRLDDRVSHLSKYCTQFSEFADLVPSYDTSQGVEEIIVQVIDTGVIQDSYFSDGLKDKVVSLYNNFKENGPPVSDALDSPQCVEMLPPRPSPDVKQRKPTEIEVQMRKLAENSEKVWNESKKILEAVEDVHKELAKIRSDQECISNRLDDVAVNNVASINQVRKFKCSFCESGYKECGLKEQCINCGIDNHKLEKCFWSGNNCSWCGTAGHASKLHQVKDQKFRLAIMNAHGHENFSHFWADQPTAAPATVQVAVSAEPVIQERVQDVNERAHEGARGYQKRGRGNGYGRMAKRYEAKPYQRSNVDPWAGHQKPFKGATKLKR